MDTDTRGRWACRSHACSFTKGNDYDEDIAIGMGGWVLSCEYRDGALEALLYMSPVYDVEVLYFYGRICIRIRVWVLGGNRFGNGNSYHHCMGGATFGI